MSWHLLMFPQHRCDGVSTLGPDIFKSKSTFGGFRRFFLQRVWFPRLADSSQYVQQSPCLPPPPGQNGVIAKLIKITTDQAIDSPRDHLLPSTNAPWHNNRSLTGVITPNRLPHCSLALSKYAPPSRTLFYRPLFPCHLSFLLPCQPLFPLLPRGPWSIAAL